jgi:4-hydroxymandelate oxidase
MADTSASRRRFLRLMAGSPLLSYAALPSIWIGATSRSRGTSLAPAGALQDDGVIASVKDAVDVMDFEAAARKTLHAAHFAYLATGVDDDGTIRANREGFTRFQIRVRRLVDTTKLDTSVRLLGVRWKTPIVLCPVGSQKAFHAGGERLTAKAARAKGHLQILSTQTSTPVEDVNQARGEPVWYQLYATPDWNDTLKIVKRVETAGCPALVFTVDLLGGTNRETLTRVQQRETQFCKMCHEPPRSKPMYEGLTSEAMGNAATTPFTWDYVKRLKDATPMKLLLKGIVTREDAELAVKTGVDGLIVSNHGGRAEASGRSTIESLPEVVAGAAGRIPIILDSGVRRGTDIFKALALGATAVGIGRPYIWGLAGFGQEGVEAVLDILGRELEMVMRQAGAPSIGAITRAHVVAR